MITINHVDTDMSPALRYESAWTAVPSRTPANHSVDGPLMGNGDMTVAVGGPPEAQCFYLAKNDFWRLKSEYGKAYPATFGHLAIRIPALAGATFLIRQTWADPQTVATFTQQDATVCMRSRVAATRNILLVELTTEGQAVEAEAWLNVAVGAGSHSWAERRDRVYVGQRAFMDEVDIPTGAAVAWTLPGAETHPVQADGEATVGVGFTLEAGRPVTLVLAMDSLLKNRDYVNGAVHTLASAAGVSDLTSLRREHAAWWADYWSKSFVEIGDPLLEHDYYRSLYGMGAFSRDPRFPPALFGIVTSGEPMWLGDYHLNYNHQAPFYGLYSANRIEQADPEDAPLLAFRERGRWYAANATKTRGVLYPVGIGPLGIETTFCNPEYGECCYAECHGLFFMQRSNAAYCLVNVAERWRTTYDTAYGQKVYPFVRDVAEFWEDYLQWEPAAAGHEGRYIIVNDAIHEASGLNMNPILSLGLVRNALDLVLDMSAELGADADRRVKWTHILENLSTWATQEKDGQTVFRYTETGPDWWKSNTLGIQHIYPGNAMGLDSEQTWLDVARNTIRVMDRWLDSNGSNSFFPAAVRIGFDPEIILAQLRRYAEHTYPNGFREGNPHGIENFSTVPNTINEMLCTGHVPVGAANRAESVLRVFPVWPRTRDARFANIRTWGAFLVAGELKDGRVAYVRILSERGRPCTVQNPWPGREVTVHRNGQPAETCRGERFGLETECGEILLLQPTGTHEN